ncbi:MAG: MFS transporter [Chloroflexi bacterium]|nr:MFS transporter [Chloroflexota bacterium]
MLPTPAHPSVASSGWRPPFFYGWLIVGMVMVSTFLGAGLDNATMGVVIKPLSEERGWSRTLASGAIAAGSIAGGLLAPLLGRLGDRVGPRLLLPAGAATVGTLLLVLSLMSEPWQFFGTYVPARALAQTLLYGVVPLTMVTNWFYLKRPRALGFATMAQPLGASALALAYQLLISHFGWRATFLTLGVLVWVLVVVPGALLLRRQPEDLGLAPDGASSLPAGSRRSDGREGQRWAATEHHWTLREAVCTRALWLVMVSTTLGVAATGGIAVHLVAYYTDLGIDPLLAAGALSLFAFSGAAANVLWGFLAERVPARHLYVAAMVLAAAVVVLLLQVRTPLLAGAVAVLLGLSARGQQALLQILLSHYFGRHSFGAISGFIEPPWRAGHGLGPLLAGAAFDLSGSYQGVFRLFVGAYLLSAFLLLVMRRPQAKDTNPSALSPNSSRSGA